MVKHIEREYSFCKSLVFAIQNITGDKTHEILAKLVSEADQALQEYEVDVNEKRSTGYYAEDRIKKYIYYPGTKIYLGAYVGVRARKSHGTTQSGKKFRGMYNIVSYNFKLPQSYVKMNDSKYDEIAVDGMLTDTSFDFNEPSVKNPKTPAEKRKEQAEKRALAKAKREAKLAAKKIP